MLVYIIPITALLLSFMSLLASLRFIFSRQGLYWVFPAIISTLLFFQNLDTLLILGESGIAVFEYTFRNFSPFILSSLWYMMIVVFHYALKKTVAENRFESDSRKNRAEAEYLMKVEMRKTRKVRKEKVKYIENKAGIPEIPEYDSPDID
ncbi:MAG: hypothetical protein IAA72_06000 [Spirochaetes bacterium]|uniref:Uncharacterized protein n=1 Tax=Candidatus Ornithospirochaeta stercoravium TaxID=2840897 RepID=A0A9D9IBG3_9SPIO|nr:hypothetical protein [Candidatus Ornithospirochaeta stercoravium]